MNILILVFFFAIFCGALFILFYTFFFLDYEDEQYISKKQFTQHKFRKYLLKFGIIKPSYCNTCKHCDNTASYIYDYRCKIPFKTVNDTPYRSQEEDRFPYIRYKNKYNTCIDFEIDDECT